MIGQTRLVLPNFCLAKKTGHSEGSALQGSGTHSRGKEYPILSFLPSKSLLCSLQLHGWRQHISCKAKPDGVISPPTVMNTEAGKKEARDNRLKTISLHDCVFT